MSIEKIKQLREITGAGYSDVKKSLVATNYNIDEAIKWLRENGISKAAKKAGRIAAEGIIVLESNDSRMIILELNSETDFVSSNKKFIDGSKKIAGALLNSELESNNLKDALNIEIGDLTLGEIIIDLTAVIGEKITLRRFETFNLNPKQLSASYKHSNSKIGVIIIGENIDQNLLKDLAMHIAAMNPKFISLENIDDDFINETTKAITSEYSKTYAGKPVNILEKIIEGAVNKELSEITLIEQSFVKDTSKKIKDLLKGGSISTFVRYEVGEGIEKRDEDFAAEVAKQIPGK